MTESNRIEFKRELTRELDIEKEVVAFLNYREAVINAIVHNDYIYGAPSKIELFSDHLEITSICRIG